MHSVVVIYEQTRIAATRLVWTVVILNRRETSRPLSKVGHFKCTVCIKSFGGQKGSLSEPPRTPLPMGLVFENPGFTPGYVYYFCPRTVKSEE